MEDLEIMVSDAELFLQARRSQRALASWKRALPFSAPRRPCVALQAMHGTAWLQIDAWLMTQDAWFN